MVIAACPEASNQPRVAINKSMYDNAPSDEAYIAVSHFRIMSETEAYHVDHRGARGRLVLEQYIAFVECVFAQTHAGQDQYVGEIL